ncbi:MAG: hypothetical protein J6J36_05610 [Clostridia bacterium]|nr:hypothetical protein [Clostridia bacterium]
MNSKMTSIISCLGIPGLIIAAIIYSMGKDKSSKYYLIQSLNATICGIAAGLASGLVGAIFNGGFIASICGAVSSIYVFALFVQILISAINQSRPQIFGLMPVVQNY